LEAGLPKIQIPGRNDSVYKDECMYSFDSPVRNIMKYGMLLKLWCKVLSLLIISFIISCWLQETETGLYVCLSTFWGLGREHVEKYARRMGNNIFLHIRRIKHKVRSRLSCYISFIQSIIFILVLNKLIFFRKKNPRPLEIWKGRRKR